MLVGVIGVNNQNATVSFCYNYGVITGKGDHVGGISGINQNTSTITKSYNYGAVTGKSRYVGRNNWF